jgi:hypothetical protein
MSGDFLKMLNRVCRDLPQGWIVRICLERDAGWVEMSRPDGSLVDLDAGDTTLDLQIGEALKLAGVISEETV